MFWPTRIFDKVCVCKDNWSGYDCSQCRYGYELDAQGRNCVKVSKPRVRRNYLGLSKKEREYVMNSLARARDITSRYSVLVEEPTTEGEVLTENNFITNVSVIDFLAWLHYYTAYTEDDGIDFAHSWSGFPTFHRQYLLLFDSELQWALNDKTFSLPYWDWTNEATRMRVFDGKTYSGTESGLCQQFARFSTFCNRSNPRKDAQNRSIICNREEFAVRKPIERQVGSTEGPVQTHIRGLPSKRDVYQVFLEDTYDSWPYSGAISNTNSFRNMLEGFAKIDDKTYCSPVGSENTVHENHNDVHIFIGGTMADVKFSATDPIFVLHHSNVDRILEMWIRLKGKNQSSYRPVVGSAPGHNAKDCIVPFFPLVRNEDMLVNSISLGYDYDDVTLFPPPPTSPADELNMCRKNGTVPAPVVPCPSPTSGPSHSPSVTLKPTRSTQSSGVGQIFHPYTALLFLLSVLFHLVH